MLCCIAFMNIYYCICNDDTCVPIDNAQSHFSALMIISSHQCCTYHFITRWRLKPYACILTQKNWEFIIICPCLIKGIHLPLSVYDNVMRISTNNREAKSTQRRERRRFISGHTYGPRVTLSEWNPNTRSVRDGYSHSDRRPVSTHTQPITVNPRKRS